MKLFQVVVLAGSVLLSACGGGGDETPTQPVTVLFVEGYEGFGLVFERLPEDYNGYPSYGQVDFEGFVPFDYFWVAYKSDATIDYYVTYSIPDEDGNWHLGDAFNKCAGVTDVGIRHNSSTGKLYILDQPDVDVWFREYDKYDENGEEYQYWATHYLGIDLEPSTGRDMHITYDLDYIESGHTCATNEISKLYF